MNGRRNIKGTLAVRPAFAVPDARTVRGQVGILSRIRKVNTLSYFLRNTLLRFYEGALTMPFAGHMVSQVGVRSIQGGDGSRSLPPATAGRSAVVHAPIGSPRRDRPRPVSRTPKVQ